MELSQQDQLRLNVMLANPIDAVRIDESRMILHALSGDNEARVELNPNCRDEMYIKHVRELLSGHALGSPGGYPVFLKRWTRMGQTRAGNLNELLKLGEPEAVTAVAGASGLTDDLARLVWWALPTSDIARCMLKCETIAKGNMGKVLAEHLVEHLPFETEPLVIIETVRLVLQPGLISDETRMQIWNKGKHKRAYHIGFMAATPDDLPEPHPARTDYDAICEQLQPLIEVQKNPYAGLLKRLFSEAGQTFVTTQENVMRKPGNQDDVVVALNTLRDYLSPVSTGDIECQDIEQIITECEALIEADSDPALTACLAAVPYLKNELTAMLVLARCGEAVVTPIFARTTAIATVMRRKLEPVSQPIRTRLNQLLGL